MAQYDERKSATSIIPINGPSSLWQRSKEQKKPCSRSFEHQKRVGCLFSVFVFPLESNGSSRVPLERMQLHIHFNCLYIWAAHCFGRQLCRAHELNNEIAAIICAGSVFDLLISLRSVMAFLYGFICIARFVARSRPTRHASSANWPFTLVHGCASSFDDRHALPALDYCKNLPD